MTFRTSICTIASHFLVRRLILRQRFEASSPIGVRLGEHNAGIRTIVPSRMPCRENPTFQLNRLTARGGPHQRAVILADHFVPSFLVPSSAGSQIVLHDYCFSSLPDLWFSHCLLHGVPVMETGVLFKSVIRSPAHDRDRISDLRIFHGGGVPVLTRARAPAPYMSARLRSTWAAGQAVLFIMHNLPFVSFSGALPQRVILFEPGVLGVIRTSRPWTRSPSRLFHVVYKKGRHLRATGVRRGFSTVGVGGSMQLSNRTRAEF
jgi:hypothetical protein